MHWGWDRLIHGEIHNERGFDFPRNIFRIFRVGCILNVLVPMLHFACLHSLYVLKVSLTALQGCCTDLEPSKLGRPLREEASI
jgi:hypothetical protein